MGRGCAQQNVLQSGAHRARHRTFAAARLPARPPARVQLELLDRIAGTAGLAWRLRGVCDELADLEEQMAELDELGDERERGRLQVGDGQGRGWGQGATVGWLAGWLAG